jgi:hypothetical protein
MTPTQFHILQVLRDRSPKWTPAPVLCALIAPGTSDKNMHVQVWKLRRSGHPIKSRRGVCGGYRMEAA